jgi:Domain of unknown function (DUF5134)
MPHRANRRVVVGAGYGEDLLVALATHHRVPPHREIYTPSTIAATYATARAGRFVASVPYPGFRNTPTGFQEYPTRVARIPRLGFTCRHRLAYDRHCGTIAVARSAAALLTFQHYALLEIPGRQAARVQGRSIWAAGRLRPAGWLGTDARRTRSRADAGMTGPIWLAAALAVVMLATAVYCTGRLAVSRRWRRSTELDADSVHAVMGVAMAGMLVPRLSPLPATVWQAVFAIAAAWFAYQAVQSWRRNTASRWQSPHPVPHLVESAAMIYMLAALPGSWPGRPGEAMAMPGMGGGRPAGGRLLALAVVLALFMIGYVLWTADQLTSLVRATATATAARDQPRTPVTAGAPASAAGTRAAAGEAHSPGSGHGGLAGSSALAPRLAACYKIAMGITMGYMLILML